MDRLYANKFLTGLVLLLVTLAASAEQSQGKALIAIIIDDLGNQRVAGERVIALPGPVACAIIPHTSYSTYLADRADAAGKEVMLHLPMQSMAMEENVAPGGIDLDTSRANFRRILEADLRNVPHVRGVNNHMGSLITRHPGHMDWLMDELLERGDLFFVDSYTTASSIALSIALDKGVPAARRNVFLDSPQSQLDIDGEFERLKKAAIQHGFAIGIGHPYPQTIEFLERALPELAGQGFELVPVSRLVSPGPAETMNQLADAS